MEIMSSIAPSKCKLECLFLGLSAFSLISARKAAFFGHSNGIDMEPILSPLSVIEKIQHCPSL
jgi:hypothetical protein